MKISKTVGAFSLGYLALLAACSRQANQYVAPPPPVVTVMTPIEQTLTRYLEENGETEAVGRAEVRTRVRGFIESIDFEPGQSVSRDTRLYTIEDDEYQATVNASMAEVAAADAGIEVAEAQVLTAQAEADRASREVSRQQTLREQNSTSQTEYDQARAANEAAIATLAAARAGVDSAQAALKQARAQLEKAQLNLGYTRIQAPIAGKVTKTDLRLGNLVEAGTQLATVVDDRQLYVNFSISDRELLELRKARGESADSRVSQEQWSKVPVFLRREGDDDFPFEGRLNYVDQQGVDRATGTLSLRALFDNTDGQLLPGLFVRVRMPIATQPGALLVPARAVVRDRVGAYLWILENDKTAQRREVRTGDEQAGWTVIVSGLTATDQVIVEGLQRVRPGTSVQPVVRQPKPSELPAVFRAATTEIDAPADQATDTEAKPATSVQEGPNE